MATRSGAGRNRITLLVILFAILTAILAATTPHPAEAATTASTEAETLALSGTRVVVQPKGTASGGKEVAFLGPGRTSGEFRGVASKLVLKARENACSGHAKLRVFVDDVAVTTVTLGSSGYSNYPVPLANLADGPHTLAVSFINDYSTSKCDRDAFLDLFSLTLEDPPQANPFANEKLWVDPNHDAAKTVAQWTAEGRVEDARQLEKIAKSPASPRYFAEWTEQHGGAEFQVDAHVDKVVADGSLPVLGAYAIPLRDCGSYSAGGFTTADEYKRWIDGFARGIGDRKAVIILEPDSIAGGSCLTDAQRQERYDMLRYAVNAFEANPKRHVYLDSGHSAWNSADVMIKRLTAAGVADATGFFLNNANFQYTENQISYGKQISAGIGGKHFVVDTSRNGLGPYTDGTHSGDCPEWANPPGRALGARPTANTGELLVDAFFWLKQPGDSDGMCGGFPRPGAWVPEYALGLAQRAAY